jgi:transcription elongation factor Elf1
MAKALKSKRSELYKDHLVQVLLSKFLSGELERLEPVFDPDRGYVYPLVEAILGSAGRVEIFLDKLSKAGIFRKKLYDKILFCPNCNSPKISIHYNCPHCRSFNIVKSALIEHLKCGYIDTEDHFRKGDKLFCPRCGNELVESDVDYKRAGIWCTCNNCDKNFDLPIPSHFCRKCQSNFTFEDAIYENAFSYELSEEAKKEASLGWILITPVRALLEERGFEVQTPGFLKGKSGTSHMFDITAFRKDVAKGMTVIDLATSADDVVTEQPVIAMFAKIYDVAPDDACLIAIPKISDNGIKMAKLYKISVIEARNQEEAVNALNHYIKEKI